MIDSKNLKKIAAQHIEMEKFWAGVSLKGKVAAPPPSTAGQDSQALSALDEIADYVNKCRCCELGNQRTNAVPGEGNSQARLVFIGEAPGADEDAQGRPFVGRSGQLLTKMIKAMGLERGDVFIGNIIKCRPPGNRDPRTEEITACIGYLKTQLEIIRPQVIVALGSHAARTLLDTDKPIGRLRGQFHDYYFSPSEPPVKLMPTYHPSYLLRNYSKQSRGKVWSDLQQVMELLGLDMPK